MPPYRDRDRDRDRDRGPGGRSFGRGPRPQRGPRPALAPVEAIEETRVLIQFLAQSLVDDSERVRVRHVSQGASGLVYELSVAPDDMGRIIGKQGRVANAIRALLKATATRLGTRVNLEIV